MMYLCVVCFFKQKTAYEMRISDWSSDVCSSDLLAIMRGEAQRMIRLVDDLMSLSRIEADKHRQPKAPVALIPLAEEVRDALGHRLAKGERKMLIDAEP